jgi:hypothetical protein
MLGYFAKTPAIAAQPKGFMGMTPFLAIASIAPVNN